MKFSQKPEGNYSRVILSLLKIIHNVKSTKLSNVGHVRESHVKFVYHTNVNNA